MTSSTFKNLEEFHLARGSQNSLESDYGGENHDDLGIFQAGHSANRILVTHVDRTGDFYAQDRTPGGWRCWASSPRGSRKRKSTRDSRTGPMGMARDDPCHGSRKR